MGNSAFLVTLATSIDSSSFFTSEMMFNWIYDIIEIVRFGMLPHKYKISLFYFTFIFLFKLFRFNNKEDSTKKGSYLTYYLKIIIYKRPRGKKKIANLQIAPPALLPVKHVFLEFSTNRDAQINSNINTISYKGAFGPEQESKIIDFLETGNLTTSVLRNASK